MTPETLAYDVIASVGPGGNFLMETHTLERCRTEFWQPAVSDRGGLEAWMQAGKPDCRGPRPPALADAPGRA